MILLTRLGGKEFFVNPDLIEFMESTPDTVLTLTTGKKVLVVQSPPEICEKIIAFRKLAAVTLPPINSELSRYWESRERPDIDC